MSERIAQVRAAQEAASPAGQLAAEVESAISAGASPAAGPSREGALASGPLESSFFTAAGPAKRLLVGPYAEEAEALLRARHGIPDDADVVDELARRAVNQERAGLPVANEMPADTLGRQIGGQAPGRPQAPIGESPGSRPREKLQVIELTDTVTEPVPAINPITGKPIPIDLLTSAQAIGSGIVDAPLTRTVPRKRTALAREITGPDGNTVLEEVSGAPVPQQFVVRRTGGDGNRSTAESMYVIPLDGDRYLTTGADGTTIATPVSGDRLREMMALDGWVHASGPEHVQGTGRITAEHLAAAGRRLFEYTRPGEAGNIANIGRAVDELTDLSRMGDGRAFVAAITEAGFGPTDADRFKAGLALYDEARRLVGNATLELGDRASEPGARVGTGAFDPASIVPEVRGGRESSMAARLARINSQRPVVELPVTDAQRQGGMSASEVSRSNDGSAGVFEVLSAGPARRVPGTEQAAPEPSRFFGQDALRWEGSPGSARSVDATGPANPSFPSEQVAAGGMPSVSQDVGAASGSVVMPTIEIANQPPVSVLDSLFPTPRRTPVGQLAFDLTPGSWAESYARRDLGDLAQEAATLRPDVGTTSIDTSSLPTSGTDEWIQSLPPDVRERWARYGMPTGTTPPTVASSPRSGSVGDTRLPAEGLPEAPQDFAITAGPGSPLPRIVPIDEQLAAIAAQEQALSQRVLDPNRWADRSRRAKQILEDNPGLSARDAWNQATAADQQPRERVIRNENDPAGKRIASTLQELATARRQLADEAAGLGELDELIARGGSPAELESLLETRQTGASRLDKLRQRIAELERHSAELQEFGGVTEVTARERAQAVNLEAGLERRRRDAILARDAIERQLSSERRSMQLLETRSLALRSQRRNGTAPADVGQQIAALEAQMDASDAEIKRLQSELEKAPRPEEFEAALERTEVPSVTAPGGRVDVDAARQSADLDEDYAKGDLVADAARQAPTGERRTDLEALIAQARQALGVGEPYTKRFKGWETPPPLLRAEGRGFSEPKRSVPRALGEVEGRMQGERPSRDVVEQFRDEEAAINAPYTKTFRGWETPPPLLDAEGKGFASEIEELTQTAEDAAIAIREAPDRASRRAAIQVRRDALKRAEELRQEVAIRTAELQERAARWGGDSPRVSTSSGDALAKMAQKLVDSKSPSERLRILSDMWRNNTGDGLANLQALQEQGIDVENLIYASLRRAAPASLPQLAEGAARRDTLLSDEILRNTARAAVQDIEFASAKRPQPGVASAEPQGPPPPPKPEGFVRRAMKALFGDPDNMPDAFPAPKPSNAPQPLDDLYRRLPSEDALSTATPQQIDRALSDMNSVSQALEQLNIPEDQARTLRDAIEARMDVIRSRYQPPEPIPDSPGFQRPPATPEPITSGPARDVGGVQRKYEFLPPDAEDPAHKATRAFFVAGSEAEKLRDWISGRTIDTADPSLDADQRATRAALAARTVGKPEIKIEPIAPRKETRFGETQTIPRARITVRQKFVGGAAPERSIEVDVANPGEVMPGSVTMELDDENAPRFYDARAIKPAPDTEAYDRWLASMGGGADEAPAPAAQKSDSDAFYDQAPANKDFTYEGAPFVEDAPQPAARQSAGAGEPSEAAGPTETFDDLNRAADLEDAARADEIRVAGDAQLTSGARKPEFSEVPPPSPPSGGRKARTQEEKSAEIARRLRNRQRSARVKSKETRDKAFRRGAQASIGGASLFLAGRAGQDAGYLPTVSDALNAFSPIGTAYAAGSAGQEPPEAPEEDTNTGNADRALDAIRRGRQHSYLTAQRMIPY
jgi:hypothetical protein